MAKKTTNVLDPIAASDPIKTVFEVVSEELWKVRVVYRPKASTKEVAEQACRDGHVPFVEHTAIEKECQWLKTISVIKQK